jgi:prepilin-type N-terminal cleavage/methylation domain-containing protein
MVLAGAIGRALLHRMRMQDGFTLPELLVVLAILPLVMVGLLSALDTTTQIAPRSAEYAIAVSEGGNGVSRMIRDLRQAYRILGSTPNEVTFDANIEGTDTVIGLYCDVPAPAIGTVPAGTYRRCVRVTAAASATLPAPSTGTVVLDRVLNGTAADPVFSFSPDAIAPTYIGVQVKLPSRGEGNAGLTHSITINNGTELRNAVLGG